MSIYQIEESTSELKIKIFGNSETDLFRHALIAMFDCVSPIYDEKSFVVKHEISITAEEKERLLVEFLVEALYLSDTKNEAYFDAHIIKLDEKNLTAVIVGKKITGFSIEIKAVTYHGVHIEQNAGVFNTDILFDI